MVAASDYTCDHVPGEARCRFGALVPKSYAATHDRERAASRTEWLAIAAPDAQLSVRIRFQQAQHRTVHVAAFDGYRVVNVLPVGGVDLLPRDETVERERILAFPLSGLLSGECVELIDVASGQDVERVGCGRVVRTRHPLTARVRVRARTACLPEQSETSHGRAGACGVRISLALTNTCPIDCQDFDRAQVMRHSLIAAHAVLTLTSGEFISTTGQRFAENTARQSAAESMS
jgi:hypothetical protein